MKREDYIQVLSPRRLRNVAKKLSIPLAHRLPGTARRAHPIHKPQALTSDELRDRLAAEPGPEVSLLQCLKTDELREACRRAGIRPGKRGRERLIGAILLRLREAGCIKAYEDYPESVDEEPDLRDWADNYCRQAEADGVEPCFLEPEYWDAGTALGATVRATCDIGSCGPCDDFLQYQRYGGPKGRGPWYVLEQFEEPLQWVGATIYLRDPWRVAFSRFHMGSGFEDIMFFVRRHGRARFGEKEQVDFAQAVLDGMRYDFDDDEFVLLCRRWGKELVVNICHPLTSFEDDFARPDADGIYWRL